MTKRVEEKLALLSGEVRRIYNDRTINNYIRIDAGRLVMDLLDDTEIYMTNRADASLMHQAIKYYESEIMGLYKRF